MRPESFPPPRPVFEQFLWDCDLNYDQYEGSKDEVVNRIMNGSVDEYNKRIVDTAWKFMSAESYKLRLEQAKDTLKDQIRQIDEALDNLRRFP